MCIHVMQAGRAAAGAGRMRDLRQRRQQAARQQQAAAARADAEGSSDEEVCN